MEYTNPLKGVNMPYNVFLTLIKLFNFIFNFILFTLYILSLQYFFSFFHKFFCFVLWTFKRNNYNCKSSFISINIIFT